MHEDANTQGTPKPLQPSDSSTT